MTTTAAPTIAPYPAADVAAAVARGLSNANDRPNPGLDATRTAQKYAVMARDFRDSAWRHLDENDLPQASNKAWGLVAETVKDISAQHGDIIHTHRAIMEVVNELARLAGNAGDANTARAIRSIFHTARNLHINFYENDLHEDIVIEGLMECEELSELLHHRFAAVGTAPGGVI